MKDRKAHWKAAKEWGIYPEKTNTERKCKFEARKLPCAVCHQGEIYKDGLCYGCYSENPEETPYE